MSSNSSWTGTVRELTVVESKGEEGQREVLVSGSCEVLEFNQDDD